MAHSTEEIYADELLGCNSTICETMVAVDDRLCAVNPPAVKGVKLPPGLSFRCCVVTYRNLGKRLGEFVGI
jgi:hypothetical protein